MSPARTSPDDALLAELGARRAQVATNGVQLQVVQAGPEDGPLVLLLHGFPDAWHGWRHQIGPLARAGFRVWAPNQRGYPDSARPRGVGAYRMDVLTADVVGLIEAAGRERACVVGHDWGGGVAWWLALHAPQRIERLAVLNAPHPLVFRRALLTDPRQLLRSWYMLLFQLPWLPEALFGARRGALLARAIRGSGRADAFTGDELERYRDGWCQPRALHSMLQWYRGLLGQRAPRGDRVAVPTLLVWGARDGALGRGLAQPSIARCAAGRLLLVEEATHWVAREEPARVNAALLEHLAPALAGGVTALHGEDADVPSPCTNVCELDARAVCTGCGRTMSEIAGWTGFDAARRRSIVAAAAGRIRARGRPSARGA